MTSGTTVISVRSWPAVYKGFESPDLFCELSLCIPCSIHVEQIRLVFILTVRQ
jgi:ribosomal protein S26